MPSKIRQKRKSKLTGEAGTTTQAVRITPQEYERKLEALQAENNNLAAQVNNLQYELANSKHLRPLLKALARTLDAGVLSWIQRLNTPRALQTVPLRLPNSQDTRVLLRAIRVYDLHHYYNARSGDRLSYKLIRGSYMTFSRGTFKAVLRLSEIKRRRRA